jgi:uncharacterized protein (TIGR02284 family)
MDTKEVISTVNDLIETSKDGEQGFRTCANGVKDARLKSFFEQTAQRCAEGAAELQTKVRSLGGDPEKSGSATGAAHRGWVNLRSTITGMDDVAVLAEAERGEDSAKRVYEKALKKDLPTDVRAIVERQYQGVTENHDRVRDMRNARSR